MLAGLSLQGLKCPSLLEQLSSQWVQASWNHGAKTLCKGLGFSYESPHMGPHMKGGRLSYLQIVSRHLNTEMGFRYSKIKLASPAEKKKPREAQTLAQGTQQIRGPD